MYAQLDESDQLVGIPEKPLAVYRYSRAITLPNGDQLPANWMTIFSQAEKEAMHIWPLVENTIDQTVERSAGEPVYDFDGTNVNAITPTQALTLVSYKNRKMQSLKGSRDRQLAEPVFITILGTEYAFSTELEARILLLHILTMTNLGTPYPVGLKWSSLNWPVNAETYTHDQVVATLTEATAREIADAMVTHEYDANKQYILLREDVNNATTHAEVDLVVWV